MSDAEADNTSDVSKNFGKYVNSIAEREGYDKWIVEKRKLSPKGCSYIGNLYEINIKGTTKTGDKQTHIFIKDILVVDEMIFDVQKIYETELFAYKELSKIFEQLQEEAHIPMEERYKMAHAYSESDRETIILENLMKNGFKTYYRMDVISIDFAKLAVKCLAKLHGISFALQNKKPEYFEAKIKPIKIPFKFETEFWKGFLKGMIEVSLSTLEAEVRERYEQTIIDKINDYPKYFDELCKVRTLCHGDYRHSNIMVKEMDGTPSEIVPVDYQIIHFGNPILDFFYLIFWGTDQEFRRKHLIELKELYYESLKNYLGYFNMNIEHVFPRTEFEKQYKERMDYGVMIAVVYLPYLFPPEDDLPDMTNPDDVMGINMKVEKLFQDRFRGIIDDFINWGYL